MKKQPSFAGWNRAVALCAILILALKLAFAGAYGPVEPLPTGIVDLHCHVAGIGAGGSGCFVSARLRDSWKFGIYLRSFGLSQKELIRSGDDLVPDRISESLAQSRLVSKAVILALDGVVGPDGSLAPDRTEVYIPNEFVLRAVARHTNLLFGASINPYRSNALERLDWAKSHGAVLIKWIPSIMNIDPADPRLMPFYKKLVELELPLLTHAGQEKSFSSAADAFCDPDKLRLPLILGVRVIAAHIASTGKYQGQRSSDRLAALMNSHPNLYSDISSLTQINKHFFLQEALTRPGFKDRLVYGSDFPLIHTTLVSPWHYWLRLSPRQLLALSEVNNPWDADVLLKQALGNPAGIFSRSGTLLGR